MGDERDELLEDVERAVKALIGYDRYDRPTADLATAEKLRALFDRARLRGVVRYPEP